MKDREPHAPVQHVYDFRTLDRVPANPTSLEVTGRRRASDASPDSSESSTGGAVLKGKHIMCTLVTQSRGTGAQAHSHPSEQFNYVLRGAMMSDIEGDRVFAPKGTVLHTPGSVVHTGLA